MDETNYFGPIKIEPDCQQDCYNDYFVDQQFNHTEFGQPQVTESPSVNNYCPSTSPVTKMMSTNSSKSDKKNKNHHHHHQHPLLNGKVAVLMLERIDPSKYIPPQSSCTKKEGRLRNLRRSTKNAKGSRIKSIQKNTLSSSDVDQAGTDNEDEDDFSPKFKRKARGFAESFPLIEKLKIPKFQGNFPCQFCSISKEYASELAVHEALHHSTTTTYKRNPKPGQQSERRHLHHCPRCTYTASRRHYYVIHHLKEHLGFTDPKLLNVHNVFTFTTGPKSTTPKQLEPCEICQLTIPNNLQTKANHFKTYHDLNQLKPGDNSQNCSLCPAYFLRGIHLLKHQQVVHNSAPITQNNKKSYPCSSCPQKFHSLRKLWDHRRNDCEMRHTFNWVATCEIEGCSPSEKFESTAELDYHMTHYHHGNTFKGEPRVCPHCGRTCIGEIGLRRHLEIHNDAEKNLIDEKGNWKCELCEDKSFKTRLLYKMHMKYHKRKISKGTNDHICDQCGKTFRIKSLLDLHYEFHKDPENWKWSCEICQKKCSTKQSLQVHQRTHTGEKPFECTVCKMKFGYRHLLRAHLNQKHNREEDKPRKYTKNSLGPGGIHQSRPKDPKNLDFWCEKCKKIFSSKQALTTHLRTHSGEMPYECEVCKERFRYRHILRIHVNKMHGRDGILDIPRNYQKEKVKMEDVKILVEFKCDLCSKMLASKQALQTHLRVHTGDKPFCCEVCGEKFRHRHILRIHVNTRHGQDGIQDLPRPYNKQGELVG